MRIVVVGAGYVGLTSAACYADRGNVVVCVDINKNKIEMLQRGELPIYEPGLEDMVRQNMELGRLRFATTLESCLDGTDIVFVAVDTPPKKEDGSADLKNVISVAKAFGCAITHYTLFVVKSTVPVGTAQNLREIISKELEKRGCKVPFGMASNPEFLKRGTAINDFMNPDRVVIGVNDVRDDKLIRALYNTFPFASERVLVCDIPSAEMIKYASNCMLATRISFMNDIANLCAYVNADVDAVRRGMAADSRIGEQFLNPGCGYGGSCFPKDVQALIHIGKKVNYSMAVLEAVHSVNETQKALPFKMLNEKLPELGGKNIAVWGLSFKPGTDDMREAASLSLIKSLLQFDCLIKVYDPVAMDVAKNSLEDKKIKYCDDMYEALIDADALVILTEWPQFRTLSWHVLRKLMRNYVIIDGRNLFRTKEVIAEGFKYERIGSFIDKSKQC